jgi:hypothetical protein
MPLKEGSSSETISENVKAEMEHGKPQKQAVAIAMNQAGKSNRDNIPGSAYCDGVTSPPFGPSESHVHKVPDNMPNAGAAPSGANAPLGADCGPPSRDMARDASAPERGPGNSTAQSVAETQAQNRKLWENTDPAFVTGQK